MNRTEEDLTIDVQWLPGAHLLIGKVSCTVSECDLRGKVLWKYEWADKTSGIRTFLRLLNGNTFLAKDFQGIEVNAQGREVFSFDYLGRPGLKLTYCPRKLEDGRLLYERRHLGSETEALVEVEAGTARLLKTVTLPERLCINRLEVIPNGNYLYSGKSQQGTSKGIQEIDAARKLVWKYPLWATHATRLRNGNTLAACAQRVVEIDPRGKMVWETLSGDKPGSVLPLLELVRLGLDGPRPTDFDIATSVAYRIKGLRSKDNTARSISANLLTELGPKAAADLALLTEALQDRDEFVCVVAAATLARLGPKAIACLIEATKDKRAHVRVGVISAIAQLEKLAKPAVPALIERLKDENVEVRRKAAWALWRIGPDADAVVVALVEALKDPDTPNDPRTATVAEWVTRCLSDLGPQAKEAVPGLMTILKGKEVGPHKYAVQILGRIGPEAKASVSILAGMLLDKHANLAARQAIPAALANIRGGRFRNQRT
jgi:HEAT repeat protein